MRQFIPLLTVAVGMLLFSASYGQKLHCGQDEATQELYLSNPSIIEEVRMHREQLNQDIEYYLSHRSPQSGPYIIPVVFHIIHDNGDENITNAQVWDAMRVLNADYNAANDDLDEVIQLFQSRIGDADFEFRLARLDPNGNPTNGIRREVSQETYIGDDGSKLKGSMNWSRDKYLNIWITRNITSGSGNNASAYAFLPADAHIRPTVDGIICNASYAGSIGLSSEQNQHTLSHEVGHYLNLYHTWGTTNSAGLSSNCGDDDDLNDTPNTIGTLGSCNLSEATCGVTANVQNFMDYATCDRMFTVDQVNRMEAALNSNIAERSNLWTSTNLNATGVDKLWEADFTASRITACQFEEIQFRNTSQYGATSFDWEFIHGNIGTSTEANPTVSFEFPGLNYTTLEASNGNESKKVTIPYVLVVPLVGTPMPYSDDLGSATSIPSDEWQVYNPDRDEYGFELNNEYGFNDQSSIKMYNINNLQYSNDELISSTYDLTVYSSATFHFRYAYKRRTSNDNDKLTVYISTDCGETWTPRWSKSGANLATVSGNLGSEYRPTSSNDWQLATVSGFAGSLLSEKTMVKFVFEAGQGNSLYLDDFSFDGTWVTQAKLRFPRDLDEAQPNNVELNWKDIDGASAYEYQLDTDAAFNTGSLITGQNAFTSLDPNDGDTRFQTSGLTNGQTYYWRVRVISNGVPQAWSDVWTFTVADNGVSINEQYSEEFKFKVYPNPSQSSDVTVSFFLRDQERISLNVIDIQGREIPVFEDYILGSGGHLFNLTQLKLENGVYIVALKTEEHTLFKRIIIQ